MAELYKYDKDYVALIKIPQFEKPASSKLVILYNGFTYDKRLHAFYAARANLGIEVTEIYFGNIFSPVQAQEINDGTSRITAYTCKKVEKVTELLKKKCQAGDLVNFIMVSFTNFSAGSENFYRADIEALRARADKENIKINIKIITQSQISFKECRF